MPIFQDIKIFDQIESGITEGFAVTVNMSDPTLIDISYGEALFSDYDGTPPHKIIHTGSTLTPGNASQDLSLVYSGTQSPWPSLSASDTVFFILLGKNGELYQTPVSPLFGDIVRDYLAISTVQIDNTVDRNITIIYPFVNINAKDYEASNVRTPTFNDANALKLSGSSTTSFDRSAGGVYFSGINFSVDPLSPNDKEFPALSPVPFLTVFRDGSGGYVISSILLDFLDYVGVYDDGTPSATPLPNGIVQNSKYVVHYVFFEASIGLTVIQIGQNVYNSPMEAIDAIALGNDNIDFAPFLFGLKNDRYIIMKGNALNFNDPLQVTFSTPKGRFFDAS